MTTREPDVADARLAPADGVGTSNPEGNARLTGTLGAVIFVLLFAEGLTILRVQGHISWHVFIGVLLIPFALAKVGTTSWRIARYYTGDRAYVRKGPPPLVLRLLGPFVSVLTLAVLGTGVAAVLDRHARGIAFAHKATFILWFGAMTIHVLGHILETPALVAADWRRTRRAGAPGAGRRLALVALLGAIAIPLAILSLQWAHHWQRVSRLG